MRTIRTILDFLRIAAISILIISAINWYPELPERIVIHLNGAGEPDGWAHRSMLLWGLFPGIGVGLSVGLQALVRWLEGPAARNPVGINIPQREAFLALSEDGRRKALAPTAIYLRLTTVLLLALFIYIVEGLGRLSTGASATWSSLPVLFFVATLLIGIPVLLRSTGRAIADAQSGQAAGR